VEPMPSTLENLSSLLLAIEDRVLEQVHNAKWEVATDGSFRALPRDDDENEKVRKNWQQWLDQYQELASTMHSLSDREFADAVNLVDRSVRFQLFYRGVAESRWRILFEYERHFRSLRLQLAEAVRADSDINAFLEKHKKSFEKFRTRYPYRWNVFVAINYDEGDEVVLIDRILKEHELIYQPNLKFHYAKDCAHERWVGSELYDNLRFTMLACDAGLFFLTKSNVTTKEILHNPNVAFEFGFMSGLGLKCEVIRNKLVKPFTDVQGRLIPDYKQAKEVEQCLQDFLEKQLHLQRV
jgi:hypothetical protein